MQRTLDDGFPLNQRLVLAFQFGFTKNDRNTILVCSRLIHLGEVEFDKTGLPN